MLPKCEAFADVGCDHGYLTLAVLENDIAKKAIAMDVNKGPLAKARENIQKAGFSDRADLRLSDGLKELTVGEADVICICGMGGVLIGRIIMAGLEVAKSAKVIVIEPQSEYYELRSLLMDEGFIILEEDLTTEENKIYPIIKISYEPDASRRIDYSKAQLEYGPKVIERAPELLYKLLDKNEKEYSSILSNLEKNPNPSDAIVKRCEELNEKLDLIQEVRNSL